MPVLMLMGAGTLGFLIKNEGRLSKYEQKVDDGIRHGVERIRIMDAIHDRFERDIDKLESFHRKQSDFGGAFEYGWAPDPEADG